MSTDVIETTALKLSENNSMPVTRADLTALIEKKQVLKEFIKGQLTEGIKGDFAVVPGTNSKSLLKPGAEKLMQLFGLRSEVEKVSEILDHNGNFAMFVYKASVFHIRSGIKIAECEASCNSKEKKYATRGEWIKNQNNVSEKVQVETPIYDILNTLMKMCQKRAIVGAVILATGASDFFTQDLEDETDAQQLGVKPSGSIQPGQAASKVSVTGNTNAHKDQLKALGGKWNMNNKSWDFASPNEDTISKLKGLDGLVIT